MKKIILMFIAGTMLSATGLMAQPTVVADTDAGWHKIGETVVNFKTEKDNIVILGADRFKAIKFKVTDASVDIQDLEVYYENIGDGKKTEKSMDKEDIQVRTPVKAGTESRVIELKQPRDLRKVTFTYRTIPNEASEKASVELWGLK